ncbi:phage tail protein [Paramixta manurensis]|uniref:Phage tail protein n=1 Tax=Paramixta manurensis TaxID=2740817 RepID=A0A6M8UG66_9GAMM|nr:phage tail protein [Erwiniaceae bacterium PD-1]
MSVIISGVLVNPAGEPVPDAQITLTSLSNSLQVLRGFSSTVETDSDGHYSIELEEGDFSITIACDAGNLLYGSVTISDTTGPATLNELLKQQLMESEVTPDVIIYFRQIQQTVATDLATMQTLNSQAVQAGKDAEAARDAAQQYATDLSAAVTAAQGARDASATSAAASEASATAADKSRQDASASEAAAAQSESNAAESATTALNAAKNAAEDASQKAAQDTADKITASVKSDADRAESARDAAETVKGSVDDTATQVQQQYDEALAAAQGASASEASAAQNASDAAGSASAAKESEQTATQKANAAEDSATAAAESQSNALTSERNAATSETNAATSADRAEAAMSDKQDKSALLSAIAALQTAANQLIYLTGEDEVAAAVLSDFARTLLASEDDDAFRENLGLGESFVTLDTDQAIGGIKKFTYPPRVETQYPNFTLKSTGSNDNDVGNTAGIELSPDRSLYLWLRDSTFSNNNNQHIIGLLDLRQFNVDRVMTHQLNLNSSIRVGSPNMDFSSYASAPKGINFFGYSSASDSPGYAGPVLNYWANTQNYACQIATAYGGRQMAWRNYNGDNSTWGPWSFAWSTGNTTVDSNGFVKKASPIARLSNDPHDMPDDFFEGFTGAGCAVINEEATGVTAERIDTGIYRISGSLGLATEGWQIEVPQDVNGNRLCFVETQTEGDGTINIKVSTRRFDLNTAMVVAGEPMDIPEGRWIDFRLSMPEKQPPDGDKLDF